MPIFRFSFSATGVLAVLLAQQAMAQAGKSPFSVGAEQGGGNYTGITGWILAQQNTFYIALKSAVHAATLNGSAAWTLAGLSFAYGVFHAAGPGHGKAVVASYMLANEQALKRGLVISLLAALLQGAVAIAIVTLAVWVFNATAQRMNEAASLIEELSYLGIVVLGLWLVWSKGRGFLAAWRVVRLRQRSCEHVRGHGHRRPKPSTTTTIMVTTIITRTMTTAKGNPMSTTRTAGIFTRRTQKPSGPTFPGVRPWRRWL